MKVADYKGYEIHYDSSSKGFSAFNRVKSEYGFNLEFVASDESQPALEKKLDELGKRKFNRFPAIYLGTRYGIPSPMRGFVTSMRESRASYGEHSHEVIVFSYALSGGSYHAHVEVDSSDLYEDTPENVELIKGIEELNALIRENELKVKELQGDFAAKLTRDRILELGAKGK